MYLDSPYHISSLWEYKSHTLSNLWYKGYQLSYKVSTKDWINKLAPIAHAKLWNDTQLDKELKLPEFKIQSKLSLLQEYDDVEEDVPEDPTPSQSNSMSMPGPSSHP